MAWYFRESVAQGTGAADRSERVGFQFSDCPFSDKENIFSDITPLFGQSLAVSASVEGWQWVCRTGGGADNGAGYGVVKLRVLGTG